METTLSQEQINNRLKELKVQREQQMKKENEKLLLKSFEAQIYDNIKSIINRITNDFDELKQQVEDFKNIAKNKE